MLKTSKHILIAAVTGCLCLVISYPLHSQPFRFPSERDNKVFLELNYKPDQKTELPAGAIEIIDARYNQNYIGVTTGVDMLINNEFSRKDILFPVKFSTYLTARLYDWFSVNARSADTLLILVKQFRLNDNILKMLLSSRRKEVFFYLSASFFLRRNDRCYKLNTVDKWFSSDQFSTNLYTNKKDYPEWLITNVLLQEILQVRFTITENTASFTRKEVDNGIAERLNLPVMKEKTKKGIFRSFTEFLLNKPSDTFFAVATGKGNRIYFLDSSGRKLNSFNAWAVCDGMKTVYLFGSSFYELELRQNTIRVRTFRKIPPRKPVAIINDLYSLGLISKKARRSFAYSDMPDYLDIDMDTGELFLEEILGLYKTSTVSGAVRGH